MISRVPLRDEVYRTILERSPPRRPPRRLSRPGYRPRRPARRQPDAGPRSPAPPRRDGVLDTTVGRGFRVRPLDPVEFREVGAILGGLESLALRLSPAPRPSASTGSAPWTGRLEQTRGDVSRCLDLEDEWHRRPARGVPQSSAARPDRVAPPGPSPLPGRLHARRRPTEPLHPAPRQDPPGPQGRRTRQWRGSIRAAVATGRRGARSLGHRGPPPGARRDSRLPTIPGSGPLARRHPGLRAPSPPQQRRARPWSPRPVRQAVDAHLDLEDELGGYEAAEARAEALRQAGDDLGRLIGAHRRNIALTQNSTTPSPRRSERFDFAAGDSILTSRADYASNQIMYLSLARRLGVEIVRAPDLPEGGVDPDAVRELVRRRRPTLVALTWVPDQLRPGPGRSRPSATCAGRRTCRTWWTPARRSASCRWTWPPSAATTWRLRRASSSAGRAASAFSTSPTGRSRPAHIRCWWTCTARPGPTRTASTLTPDARRFESWEIAYALVLGLGAAARYALERRHRDRPRPARARSPPTPANAWPGCPAFGCSIGARSSVRSSPWIRRDAPGAGIKLALRARGINTSSPAREDAVIDMDAKGAASALRISPHYYNTAGEIETVASVLGELVR